MCLVVSRNGDMLGCELCCNLIRSKKGINMYAVDTAGKVAGGSRNTPGKPASLLTESLKPARTASISSGLSFARCWFSAGREGIFLLFHQSLFLSVITNKGNKCQYQQYKGRHHIPYIKNRFLYHF